MRTLFSTLLYQQPLGDDALVADLEASCLQLAEDDSAGRRWCRENHYRGYTSYASLNDLPIRDPAFADLKRLLDKHVAKFAEACAFDLAGRKLKLDSLWVNVLDGARGLKLEDPRLAMMMAAPTRRPDAPESLQPFIEMVPDVGTVLLWESWLRHEVPPGAAKDKRISVSFNYRW